MTMHRARKRKSVTNNQIIFWVAVLIILLGGGKYSTNHSPVTFILVLFLLLITIPPLMLWFILQKQLKFEAGLRRLGLDKVDTMTGDEFEKYVGALMKHQGYTSVRYTSASGDEGADLYAKRDGQTYVIQAKRYASAVGIDAIQQAIGARIAHKQDRAMVVTNNRFTKPATEYAAKVDCELIDRSMLAEWAVATK
jgi:restriction system protein